MVLRSLHRNVHKSPGSNWDYELIIDSGANASLVCERRLLSKLVPLKSKVKGIDDTLLLDVKGQGCLKIRLDNGMTIDIEGVLYVPDSKFNLISVDSITKSTHFEVLFGKNDCLLTDPNNPGFSQVLGYNHGGLYHLASKCIVWDQGQTTNSTRGPFSALAAAAASTLYKQAGQLKSGVDFENVTSKFKTNLRGDYTLFDAHCILGHPSLKVLDLMVKRGQLNPVKVDKVKIQHQIENCPECVITKLVRTPHNSGTDSNKANHPLERIHVDLSGPYEIRGEKKYFMAIKDEFSGYIHVEFIVSKTQTSTLRVLDNFLKLMKSRVPQYEVRCIRTDNGTEFHNKSWDDYLHERMISRDEIAPYSPQSNGFAESTNHQLKLRAKCLLLLTDNIDNLTLYDYAIVYASYLLNRTVNIRRGKTPFELLFHRMPTIKNLIRFGADVLVKLPHESIVKSRSNVEAVCGTFLGTAMDSNCHRVWLKGDSKMRVLLTTDVRPLKSFNFLTHSLKVYCEALKDPRANFVDEPGSTTGSGSCMVSSNGSEQSRRALPSLSTVKDITAHDSSDNGTHTTRYRPESGETSYTSVSPIDHDQNLAEDSAPLKEPMMDYESNCSDIENHKSEVKSINKLEAKIENNQPEVLAKPGEELAKSHKPVSDMKCEAPEDDRLRRTSDYAEPSVTTKNSDAPQDPQNDSTGTKIKLQEDLTTTQVSPRVMTKDSAIREQSTTLTRKSNRSTKTSRRRPRNGKKSGKTPTDLHRKPLIVTVPDESNDIQMIDDTEMPFLLAPVNETEYQNMLNSIDYQLVHSTVPSHIQDIALTEASNTFPSDNDCMIMDEIPSLEPVMSNVGEQPSVQVCDGNLEQREVLGPTIPNSLVRPAENVVRASSSEERTGGNTGLPMPQPQRGDSSRPISGEDVTIPPASEGHSHQDLSRRDRDAELEIVAQRAAEQVVAMLEQRYSTNERAD